MTIPCPCCGACTEAIVHQVEADQPIFAGPTLHLVLPAWECLGCGQTWEDASAAYIRDHAIREALGEGNDQW